MLACYEEGGGQTLSRLERKAIVVEMARIPLYWIGEAAFLADALEAVLAWARDLAVAGWLIQWAAQLEPLLPAGLRFSRGQQAQRLLSTAGDNPFPFTGHQPRTMLRTRWRSPSRPP